MVFFDSKIFETFRNLVAEGMSSDESDKIHVMNKSIVIKRSVLNYIRAHAFSFPLSHSLSLFWIK